MSVTGSFSKYAKLTMIREALRQPYIYNIVSVLRGPDTGHESIKYIFTARIRSFLLRGEHYEGLMIRDNEKIPFSYIVDAILEVDENDYHYLDHAQSAVESLNQLGILETKEYDMLSALVDALIKLSRNDNELHQATGMNLIMKIIDTFQDMIIYDILEEKQGENK
ncbi:MAG: hypothetical protein J7K21_00985 [Desulfurococcales archaeon]|nr:hypothetical protein [Desulfurococcales archaeon]